MCWKYIFLFCSQQIVYILFVLGCFLVFVFFGISLYILCIYFSEFVMYRLLLLCIPIIIAIGFVSDALQFSFWPWFSHARERTSDAIVDSTGDLFISPYGTEQRLLDILWSTKDILYIQTYDFTQKKVRELVKKLALWWTDVRIMQENRKFQQYADTYQQVVTFFSGVENVQIQSDERLWTTYLHTKLDLLDDRYVIKSANLTQSAFKNREYFFVWSDLVIWQNLHDLFLKDWYGETIEPADIHPNLLVCPINCRDVIQWLIISADSSIRIQTQYITDKKIIQLLQEKTAIDIRLNVADLDSNDDVLYYFWPTIARVLPKPYVHAKTMLIDDKYLYIGSINFSAHSMDENRELWIVVTDPTVIAQYVAQFDRDWAVSEGKRR